MEAFKQAEPAKPVHPLVIQSASVFSRVSAKTEKTLEGDLRHPSDAFAE